MSKKQGNEKTDGQAPPATAAAATRAMDRLIADKEREVGDGSLQVILAIASVSSLVTVNTSTSPATLTPSNLGQLTFNDVNVGLSNTQMAIFKANLTTLLPRIATDIAKIPENAALNIVDVAKFVRLALLAV
jgi:hypothetical protein